MKTIRESVLELFETREQPTEKQMRHAVHSVMSEDEANTILHELRVKNELSYLYFGNFIRKNRDLIYVW